MLKHHRILNWRRVYDYYLAHLCSHYLANFRRNREFYINTYTLYEL